MLNIKIREYLPNDCEQTAKLFYDTVHTINKADYSQPQLNAWADGNIDLSEWNNSLLNHYSLVAHLNDIIVGFGDITSDGYLDRLYVHKDYQKMGIGKLICDKLETSVSSAQITVHASITAKNFFKKRDYKLIRENRVERHGIILTNYVMKKTLNNF